MPDFALFGPSEKHFVPMGGFCISVFAVLQSGSELLLGKPRQHGRWQDEWAPNWRLYDSGQLEAELRRWRFPSSYVEEGESPEHALGRVMNEQLGVREYTLQSSRLLNFYEPSRRYPGRYHWDYCFVFRVMANFSPHDLPWFSELRYIAPSSLDATDFGSAQGAILMALNTH